jgi:hypothetical protein
VYFWTKGYRLSVEESRFHEIIASGKTRLEIDVHDVSLFGTTRNRVKMTPSPDIIQLFGFISAHVHAKTYIHEDIPGKVRTDFPLDPVYVKIISLLQKKKEVGETQIVCVPKTDYVSSLDGVSVYDCAVVPQLRNDCKTADRLAKRRKVETDCNTEIEPIDTTACAFSILTEMYEEFASVCNTGTLLTQREMNMRFPYITKFWRLFQGKGVAAPDRYSQWLWNAEDTFDGSLPFTLSERVLAAVIPLQVFGSRNVYACNRYSDNFCYAGHTSPRKHGATWARASDPSCIGHVHAGLSVDHRRGIPDAVREHTRTAAVRAAHRQ